MPTSSPSDMSPPITPPSTPASAPWLKEIAEFRKPALGRSLWQLANSILPYLALWAVMIWSLSVSYLLTLALSVFAAGFLVRVFIIFHDCGHGSFFKSRRANRITEFVTGTLVFSPYRQWRHKHAIHHATSGDLDRRGGGDIWTMTVQEYLDASRGKRFAYRVMRNPIVLFAIIPIYLFLIQHRVPSPNVGKHERRGVHMTNLALLVIIATMWMTIGIKAYLMIQLPIMLVAAIAGVWLFYVQHQFEDAHWARREEWDYVDAALQGSSFYKLPKILQWFTGNIGFHHIHHLSPAIPNYNLERCHKASPTFSKVKPLTLWQSLRAMSFRLWDEQKNELVGFRALKDRVTDAPPTP